MKTIQTLTIVCILGCQLQAQVSFFLSSSPGVGSGPRSVAVADVNGDGKMDLISANYYGNSLLALTNNGNGGFVLSGTYTVGTYPMEVVTADVNGDGRVDLICANQGNYQEGGTLTVLTNNSSGGFVLAGTYAVGIETLSVTAADVNGDGKMDLICANYYSDTLTILTNKGSGGFVIASSPVVGSGPYTVTAADVNGDGKVDLITANWGSSGGGNTLTVLTNNGSGIFGSNATLTVGSGPIAVAAADVNGDGKVDLITANWGSSGGGNTLTVLTNNGSGIFGSNATLTVGSGPIAVAAADVNGDGNVDLISANYNANSLSVLTNNGSGGFVLATNLSVVGQPNSVTAADVNGDGKVDLISPLYGPNVLAVFTNATPFSQPLPPPLQAPVSFKLSSSPGTGSDPRTVAAADVNGDGKMDLISANYYGGSLSVLTNNGSGGFVLSGTYTVGTYPLEVVTADVNGDGKVDLICANSENADSTLSVLTNNGSGGFVLSGTYSVGAGPYSVVPVDVNGDGKVDLVTANWGPAGVGNTLTVLTNNGSGGFVFASTLVVGHGPVWVAAADVNGDGKVDLISANWGASGQQGNTLTVLTNNGSGGFVLASSPVVGSGPYMVTASDVNGDGKVDLITANWGSSGGGNTLTVLTNSGSGIFGSNATLTVGSGCIAVSAADVNGDGKVDLISANYYANSLSVLTNNGNGGFVLATNLSAGGNPNSVTAADVNGDGKVDLISPLGPNNVLAVFTNATPFSQPPPPIYGSQILFSDDFNGPQLNPLWVTNLPYVPNAQGSPPETYMGAPSYQFETLGSVPVLRMNTYLPTFERVGWSLNKKFSTTDFRYEVRFNTLTQSSSTSIDGFIEVWVLNSTNFNNYDLVSLYGGYYGTHIFFDAVSSVTGNNIQQDTLGTGTITNNTYYRLVLQGGANQNIRASLCDDLGNELYGYDLGHTTKAYPAGFTIGISQAIGAAGAVYPTDVAIASAVVTTTNILIPLGSPIATGTATMDSGFVVSVMVTNGGYGYTNTPLVRFIGGGGKGAQAVAVVSNGVVTAVQVLDAGYGYTSAPQVLIDPPFIPNPVLGIAPMSFLSFSNLTVGGVYQLQQLFQWYWTNQSGSFMASNALYTQMVAGAVGSGNYRLALNPAPTQAFATPQVVNGFVVGATMTSGGSGYVTSPGVSIVGGHGTNATAVSHISGGVVTGISIVSPGAGYTNTPMVEIAPPPAAAVSPTVFPVMRVDSANLAPYYNYQIQFKPDITAPWINWGGGLFSPTDITNSQFIFITNSAGLFRVQYVP